MVCEIEEEDGGADHPEEREGKSIHEQILCERLGFRAVVSGMTVALPRALLVAHGDCHRGRIVERRLLVVAA